MTAKKTYDLFITHAWRYHEDWNRMTEALDKVPGLVWRNFSLPWHDPAIDPNTELGSRLIRESLEGQIIPAHGVIFLDGVYAVKSARRWLDLELEIARRFDKLVIGVPPIGQDSVSAEVSALCNASVGWDGAAVIAALEQAGQRGAT